MQPQRDADSWQAWHVAPAWVWAPTLLQTLLAAVLCFVPLFDLLAYEFCLATAALAAITAPIVGFGVSRSAPDGRTCIRRAAGLAVMHLLPGLVLITFNATRVRNCDYGDGLLFFALLPVMSAIYGALLGAVVGRLGVAVRGWWRALLLAVWVWAPLCLALWDLFWEPPIFVFDHLWGYFAGSLYDESINVEPRLWYFRLGTGLRIASLAAALLLWDRRHQWGLGRVIACGLAMVTMLGLYDATVGRHCGFRTHRDDILRVLSTEIVRPNIVIHLPPGLSPTQQAAIADDHAFRLQTLLQTLDVTLPQPIHSYVYADAEQKAQLMGGRNTMIAKPWLHEIHVHNPIAPHPVVPHELAHAVAAEFGSKLLKVSARHEVLVNMGWVEGFATALTPEQDELDLHHWAKAMRSLHLAPDVRDIVGPAGFWAQAPKRAYTVAGSFVRYLLTTHGADALKAAYPAGDFQAAYKQDLNALVKGWEAFLETITVSEREQHIAAEKFRVPSIFMRPCAHEIAQLTEAAQHADATTAVALQRTICTHLDNAPVARLGLAMALLRANDSRGFLDMAHELVASHELNAVQQADLLLTRAALHFENNRVAEARADAQNVLRSNISVAMERLAWAYLWAMDLPPSHSATAMKFLTNTLNPTAAVLWLDRATNMFPQDKMFPYLIGRQLVRVQSWEDALHYLETAHPHPLPAIEAERQRLVADSLWQLQRWEAAAVSYEAATRAALTSGEVAQARDWLRRIAWQQSKHR